MWPTQCFLARRRQGHVSWRRHWCLGGHLLFENPLVAVINQPAQFLAIFLFRSWRSSPWVPDIHRPSKYSQGTRPGWVTERPLAGGKVGSQPTENPIFRSERVQLGPSANRSAAFFSFCELRRTHSRPREQPEGSAEEEINKTKLWVYNSTSGENIVKNEGKITTSKDTPKLRHPSAADLHFEKYWIKALWHRGNDTRKTKPNQTRILQGEDGDTKRLLFSCFLISSKDD